MTPECNDFHDRWQQLWQDLALPAPDAAERDLLLDAWSEPHRAYHTLQHLAECLQWLDRVRHRCAEPAEVEFALWLHDAVYQPRRHDNEARSAAWAQRLLSAAGASPERINRSAALILATGHNVPVPPGDAVVMVDIDLAILGAAPERFAEYQQQVRREYRWVPGPLYRRERRRILLSFLARAPLYQTPEIADACEALARRNLNDAVGG